MITFNKPVVTGEEFPLLQNVFKNERFSGNGEYTKKVQNWFESRYHFKKCLFTTSCTDALEMAALLLDIKKGDEILMPSYTFVSTANAFILRGATIRFIDSQASNPNLDISSIENLITPKTKAIVAVHYSGFACPMEQLISICRKYNITLIEDAAQAIDNYFINNNSIKQPLGSFGDMATFSFHETKNLHCGEGGLLVINNEKLISRAEIIWEKGTNRSAFYKGIVDKYGWVDIGSSFLGSELNAAFLYAQLLSIDSIQSRRRKIWKEYHKQLEEWSRNNQVQQPLIPEYSTNNAHLYYLVMKNEESRDNIISSLQKKGIQAVFHYQSLHKSPFFIKKHDGRELENADKFSTRLVRLPLYPGLDYGSVIKEIIKINPNN